MLMHYVKRAHIVETEPFQVTFGPKAQRKKPRIVAGSFEELGKTSAEAAQQVEKDEETQPTEEAGSGAYYTPFLK